MLTSKQRIQPNSCTHAGSRLHLPGPALPASRSLFARCGLIFASVLITLPSPAIAASLTWEAAVQQALQNHPAIVSARRVTESAETNLQKLSGGLLPQITLKAKPYSQGYDNSNHVDFTTSEAGITTSLATQVGVDASASFNGRWTAKADTTLSISLAANAALDPAARLYSSTNLNLVAARNALQKAQWDEAAQEKSVALATLATFWQLELDAQRLILAQETAKDRADDYARMVERQKSGLVNKADVLAAEIELRQAEAALRKQAADYQAKQAAFAADLGLTAPFVISAVNGAREDELQSNFNSDSLVKAAQDASITVRKHRLDLEYSRLMLKQAEADMLPDVSLGASFAVTDLANANVKNNRPWSVALSVSWPLADSGRRRLTVQDRQAEVDNLSITIDRDIDNAAAALRAKLAEWDQAVSGVQIARLRLAKAQIESTAKAQQYQAGLVNASTNAAAQRAVRSAEIDLQAALNAQRLVELEIANLTGGQLTVAGKPLLP